jgi:predicted phage terminase large subunit-like protein
MNLLCFGSIDPSLGKHGAGGDPSAILVGGLHRETMTLHVLEASIAKRHPDAIIAETIALHAQYSCLLWAVDAVQFQEFFADVLRRSALEQGMSLPVRAVKAHTDKRLRIESLQPHMARKRILLHPSQTTLIGQLRHFPKADHDDGPDALHQLWEVATKGFAALVPESVMRHAPRCNSWRGG